MLTDEAFQFFLDFFSAFSGADLDLEVKEGMFNASSSCRGEFLDR